MRMNILSFDIEEWYLEKLKGGNRSTYYCDLGVLLTKLLDKLDEQNIKATFFCLGKMATDFPEIVSTISRRGHDIGCHSHNHQWLTKMSADEMYKDTKNAKDALEQVIGQKVTSYRAPAFTITEKNPWAIQVLVDLGFEVDSSIFPIRHEIGGYSSFPEMQPCIINYNNYQIKEFPLITTQLFGKNVAYSGGGYFRMLPYFIIQHALNNTGYFIGYFHLSDLLATKIPMMSKDEYERYFKEKGSLTNRFLRYAKCNMGVAGAYKKLEKLVSRNSFMSVKRAVNTIDWNKANTIHL